jgi:predicted MFS family arabinose efflux permease
MTHLLVIMPKFYFRKDCFVEKELSNSPKDFSTDLVSPDHPSHISRVLVWTMSITCGAAVANLYYIQPLLAIMAHDFSVSTSQIGSIATLGQIGYTIGLLLIVPLGDRFNQRSLIVFMSVAVAISLILMALAPTMAQLGVASLLIGITTVVPQLIIPYAAGLAPDRMRGRVVGSIMTGLLIGILAARIVSGFVGAKLGWHAIYWIAAGLMIIQAIILRILLPNDTLKKGGMKYLDLLRSLWGLLKIEPVLRETSILGALTFACFSAFWVTSSFLLETPPYHLGSDIVGLFGLVGIAGALAASLVGKLADRRDPRFANGIAISITLFSFLLMWFTGQWLLSLVIGVMLLDLGTQANQVTNQARIYSLNPLARSRLNTVYMVSYFTGGALGSLLGTVGWSIAKWNGVCIAACLLMIIALSIFVFNSIKKKSVI